MMDTDQTFTTESVGSPPSSKKPKIELPKVIIILNEIGLWHFINNIIIYKYNCMNEYFLSKFRAITPFCMWKAKELEWRGRERNADDGKKQE